MSRVTTPPRVHRTQLDAALRRIASRREKIGDDRFGHIDHESPGQVLDYIQRNPTVHRWVAQADVNDGLVLWVWMWWDSQRRLHALLTRGHSHGMPLAQLGSPLGMGHEPRRNGRAVRNNRIGVRHRMDRLAALLKYDIPDAELTREERRAARDHAGTSDERIAWLVRHRGTVVAVADRLLAVKEFANDDAYETLLLVAQDRRADEWSPLSLELMSEAVAEMRTQPDLVGLPSRHRVKRACHAVDGLCTAFTKLSTPLAPAADGGGPDGDASDRPAQGGPDVDG